jgi:hypothetical protein
MMMYRIIKTVTTIAGIAYLSSPYTFLAVPIGIVLANAPAPIFTTILVARFITLAGRSLYSGYEWQIANSKLPTKPYDFTNLFNSTCPVSNLKTLTSTNFPEINLIDNIIAANNFRPTVIIKAIEQFVASYWVNTLGILISLYNERYGTHSLLKEIKSYSENHKCPTVDDVNKMLAFSRLSLSEENIHYGFVDLWTQPLFALAHYVKKMLGSTASDVATEKIPHEHMDLWIQLTQGLTNDHVALAKTFSNLAFHYKDTCQLEFFQNFVKFILIPYWEAHCFTAIARKCPIFIISSYAYEQCNDTEERPEWHHPEIKTNHPTPTIHEINIPITCNTCFEDSENAGGIEGVEEYVELCNITEVQLALTIKDDCSIEHITNKCVADTGFLII